jgi:hypothetical protein
VLAPGRTEVTSHGGSPILVGRYFNAIHPDVSQKLVNENDQARHFDGFAEEVLNQADDAPRK